MATIDPSGFQMSVVIIADDRRYNLWSNQGSVTAAGTADAPSDDLPDSLPIVESLNIEIGLGLNHQVTVNIAAPYELGLSILSSRLLRVGNVVEVQIGYPRSGRFMPWVSALCVQPSIKISPSEGLTATINGQGGAFAALRNSRTTEYQNQSYAEIINTIAGNEDYNFIVDLPDQDGSDDPLYVSRERVSQSGSSDWFFIQFITRAANCDSWVEPDRDESGRQTFKVARRANTNAASPVFTFVMRGNADFDRVWPILDFESNAEGVWLPGGATGVRTGGFNVEDLTAFTVLVTPENPPVPTHDEAVLTDGGTRVEDTPVRVTTTRDEATVGEHLYVPERDPRGPTAVATSHFTESGGRGGIQAKIESLGIPDLYPNDIIAVSGIGIFDSYYLVQNVSHRLAAGDWSMTLELLNNAHPTDFLAQALRGFSPRVNSGDAPTASSDATGGGTEVVPEPEV